MSSVRASVWFDPADVHVEGYDDSHGTPWAVVDFDALNGARLALFVRSLEQVDALETALGKVREHLSGSTAAKDAA